METRFIHASLDPSARGRWSDVAPTSLVPFDAAGGGAPRDASAVPPWPDVAPTLPDHDGRDARREATPALSWGDPSTWPADALPPGLGDVLKVTSGKEAAALERALIQRIGTVMRAMETLSEATGRRSFAAPATPSASPVTGGDDDDFNGFGVNSYLMAATFLAQRLWGEMSQSQADAMSVVSKRMAELSAERREKLAEEREQRAQEASKARKGGIIGAVLDWIVPIFDVVVGVAKLVTGVLTANPMLIAGGVLNLASGVVGLGAATVRTLSAAGIGDASKMAAVAEGLSYAQMALSTAAAVVDITSSARNAILKGAVAKASSAAKEASKLAANAAEGAADQAMKATTTVAKEAALGQMSFQTKLAARAALAAGRDTFAKHAGSVVQEVVAARGGDLIKAMGAGGAAATAPLARHAGRRAGKLVATEVAALARRHVSRRAGQLFQIGRGQSGPIARMVQRATNRALTRAARDGLLGSMTAEKLASSVAKNVAHTIRRTEQLTSLLAIGNAVRQGVAGAGSVAIGAIGVQTANLRHGADVLNLNRLGLEARHRDLGTDAESLMRSQRSLSESHRDVMRQAQDAVTMRSHVRMQVANGMA